MLDLCPIFILLNKSVSKASAASEWHDHAFSAIKSWLFIIWKNVFHPWFSFFDLASVEKRNLANAQKKKEIEKRLKKVQTQLGTKIKSSSADSLAKRGIFSKRNDPVELIFIWPESLNFNSTTGVTTGLTNAPSGYPSETTTAAPISLERLSESSPSESDLDSSHDGDDTGPKSG